ncbi:putative sec1-like protein [Helianthus annuus]|uniref:Putative vacuolar protein sorting 45 n=1 Tax=Helianthus annuus TaxID=4232 RepID=A0A251U142_HELAN|nr:vacuolar protein sorting-associated protein 45 homolog [Helianthus annuus]KAF5793253.1 putative sec1-like protein [Helianthus annuus]KAJ0528091.1 putative sec1-like protein [Helianthus annuus]KAJ0536966.1 putative sec1-like protein [Helianthus annuus]KAJ0544526.1 putative sec1-like protein [Helianthus annuus]KAJ0709530.1 putative sec1-like protein [Helianthus annuus]
MVVVSSVRDYINRMLQDISGMKVLILDSQTVSVVSVVYSQSELLQKQVFLVELVDSISMSKESMSHLKAVYFLRPTSENIQHFKRQLAKPRFGEYNLFFSNMLNTTQLHILADSDEHEVVQQVQEFFADFVALDPYHFTLNTPSNHMYMLPAVVDPPKLQTYCDRIVDGIAAIFLALKRRPVIRYSRTSDIAKRIAHEASKLMYQQESGLFDFRRTEISPLLLVIDRRDDPVTPLLNQWTYQAMVHELIGIKDNKVDLGNVGKDEQQEVVLSSEQDAFFKANMYENFGDIGMSIKRMVDDFQQVAKSNQNIQTIEDMAKFVDNYPEYRKMQGNVSKHVTLVTEMSKIVEERKLMLVSQTEQELACNGGQGAAFEAVTNLLNNESVSDMDRLRLVMLYALRYEKESPVQLMQLFNKLASRSPKYKPGLVQFLLKQAGVDRRTGDLYGNRDILNIARNMARGLKGVENVYTQHQPLLFQTMESITKGRLRDLDYPFVGNHFQQGRPQEVVIFIVGGTTYEESRSVALQNSLNSGIRFILGGSTLLNSKRFLKDLEEAQRIVRSSTGVV